MLLYVDSHILYRIHKWIRDRISKVSQVPLAIGLVRVRNAWESPALPLRSVPTLAESIQFSRHRVLPQTPCLRVLPRRSRRRRP